MELRQINTTLGFPIYVLPGDQLSESIAMSGIWEPFLGHIMETYIKPGMNAIDIGCHIGYHSIHMAHLVGPLGKVWCYDANPILCEVLDKSIKLNQFEENCFVTNLGISKDGGDLIFSIEENSNPCMGTFYNNSGIINAETTMVIPTKSLDQLFPETVIDFIKIDAEFLDLDVITGGKKLITRCKPIIAFEWHGKNLAKSLHKIDIDQDKELLDFFAYLGFYRLYRLYQDGSLKKIETVEDIQIEEIIWGDPHSPWVDIIGMPR